MAKTNWVNKLPQDPVTEDNTVTAAAMNTLGAEVNTGRVFVQQADPEVTNPEYVGDAVWYVLDGSGNAIDVKVRA